MSIPCTFEAPWTDTDPVRTEKRAEPRYSCPRLVRVRPVTVPAPAFRLSLVQNISASGIGLLLSNACEPGTLLEIEARGRSVINRFARVIHCTKQQGGWLVGCTLNHSLSEAELERMLS